MNNREKIFDLMVTDESMNLDRILEGDVILCSHHKKVENGKIAVVSINGEMLVRRIFQEGTIITLVPNSSSPVFSSQVVDVTEEEVEILGMVNRTITDMATYIKFKSYMMKNGINREDLANLLGKARSYINHILNGTGGDFSMSDVRKICLAYGISSDAYFDKFNKTETTWNGISKEAKNNVSKS